MSNALLFCFILVVVLALLTATFAKRSSKKTNTSTTSNSAPKFNAGDYSLELNSLGQPIVHNDSDEQHLYEVEIEYYFEKAPTEPAELIKRNIKVTVQAHSWSTPLGQSSFDGVSTIYPKVHEYSGRVVSVDFHDTHDEVKPLVRG